MSELLLNITLINLCRRGEPGAQGMAREHCQPFGFRQIGSDAALQNGCFDQPCDVLVGKAGLERTFAIPRCSHEDRPEVDLCKIQAIAQVRGQDRSGRLSRARPRPRATRSWRSASAERHLRKSRSNRRSPVYHPCARQGSRSRSDGDLQHSPEVRSPGLEARGDHREGCPPWAWMSSGRIASF